MTEPRAAFLPWRNITDEWNKALNRYTKRTGRFWHGRLRGSRSEEFPMGQDNKCCTLLVVVDNWQGRPIDLSAWNGYPDYWDFQRIIAHPYDAVFRGVKGGDSVVVEDMLDFHVDRIVAMHNASLEVPA